MIKVAIVQFATMQGHTYLGEIYSDTTETPASVYELIGRGITINYGINSQSIQTPIKGSQCRVRIADVEKLKASSFMADYERSHKFILYEDEEVIWQGYMMPDQWNEQFAYLPSNVSFSFVDGIGLLKDEYLTDENDCPLRGIVHGYRLFSIILRKIGITRTFIDAINIFDENTTDEDKELGTLGQRMYDLEAFAGMNCYEILTQVLQDLISRIEYRDDIYYIRRIDNAETNVYEVRYEYDPTPTFHVPVSASFVNNSANITGGTSTPRLAWQDTTQARRKVRGWKTLTINHIYGRKKSIFPRSGFNECDWINDENIKNWNHNGIERHDDDEGTFVKFKRYSPVPPVPYIPPAFVEVLTEFPYSNAFIDNENEQGDLLVVELVMKNGDYQPYGTKPAIVYGPRGGTGSITAAGTIANNTSDAEPGEIAVYEAKNGRVKWFSESDGYGFLVDLDSDPFNIQTNNEPNTFRIEYIIFTNPENSPTVITAGIPYYVVDDKYINTGGGLYSAKLSETLGLGGLVEPGSNTFPDEDDVWFEAKFIFSYVPVILKTLGTNETLANTGEWRNQGELTMVIPPSNVYKGTRFKVRAMAADPLLSGGKLSLNIQKIKETYKPNSDTREGSWLLDEVNVTIAGTPEKKTEKITFNNKNRIQEEITIFFAEPPIKNNHANNVLKYRNNVMNFAPQQTPGRMYYHTGAPSTVVDQLIIKYGLLYNAEVLANIANTSTDDWRVPNWDDMASLATTLDSPSTVGFEDISIYESDTYLSENTGSEIAGKGLKSQRTGASNYWHPYWRYFSDIVAGNDSVGFSAQAGGIRQEKAGSFVDELQTSTVNYWVDAEFDGKQWARELRYNDRAFVRKLYNKKNGCCIRLCRDATAQEISDNAPATNYIDNDGNEYRCVVIDGRVWMAENLIDTKYFGGADIDLKQDYTDWENATAGAYCIYEDKEFFAFQKIMKPNDVIRFETMKDIIINFYRKLYTLPRWQVTGKLNAKGVKPFFILTEPSLKNYLLWENLNWDVQMNEWDGTWQSINNVRETGVGDYGGDYSNDYNN